MASRPAFPIATAFAVGILIAQSGPGLSAILMLVAAAVSLALLILRRRWPGAPILIIVVLLGWIRAESYMSISDDDISHFRWKRIDGFSGIIAADVDTREDRSCVLVRVENVRRFGQSIPVSGKVMVTVYCPSRQELEYGEKVFIISGLRAPMPAANPGSFSWAEYLARQQIYTVASVRTSKSILILSNDAGNPMILSGLKVKRWLESNMRRMFPTVEGRLVESMLLGNYALLPDHLIAAFTRSGTLHLLAASGFNCMVLVTVFGLPLSRGLRLSRNVRSLILIGLLVLYVLVIGAKPSILRAATMASLVLLAYPLGRAPDALNLLFVSAIIILAARPTDLFDVGFQLSFAAVMAISFVLPVLTEVLRLTGLGTRAAEGSRSGLIRKMRAWLLSNFVTAALVTAAAMLGTAPLTAHYFNYVSIISPIANLLAGGAIEPIFALGISAPFVGQVPALSDLIAFLGTNVARIALAAVSWLGNMPRAAISVCSPGVPAIIGYYILLSGLVSYACSRAVRR